MSEELISRLREVAAGHDRLHHSFTSDLLREAADALSAPSHSERVAVPDASDWGIDLSTGRKILVYKNCSVIEDEQAELILAMLAAPTPVAVPEGWVLVPVRATDEMLSNASKAAFCSRGDANSAWISMLSVAPSAPASQGEAQSGIDSPHNACMHRDDCRTLRAQLAEREAELSKSDARLHEVAVACATAEEKLAASEAREEGLRVRGGGLLDAIDEPPEANCGCHLAPPCSDCVDYGHLREAIRNFKAALSQPKGDSNDGF